MSLTATRAPSQPTRAADLLGLSAAERGPALAHITLEPHQVAPGCAGSACPVHGDQARQLLGLYPLPPGVRCRGDWDVWLLVAGRGAGKTLAGANVVIEHLRAYGRAARVGVMAPTRDAARDVCMDGPSGLSLWREEFTQWNPSRGFARHYLGGEVFFLSAEKPARWNGPQWSLLWADELALCNPDSWTQADLGLRLGSHPRAVVTTTPKGSRWLRELSLEARVDLTRATTYDNPHLSERVLGRFAATYEGTTLGRQELLGEWLDFVPGAVFPTLHAQINDFLRPVALNVEYARTGAGVDWGTTLSHQSAVVAGSSTKPGQIIIRSAWKSPSGSSYELAGELGRLKDAIEISFARVDRSQGSLIDVIDALGLDADYGVRDVEWRIGLMRGLIERRRIVFDLNGGDGVRELFDSLCQYHRDDDDRIVEEADDDVDACMYLIAEFEQPAFEPPAKYGSTQLRTRKQAPASGLVRRRSAGMPGRRRAELARAA